MKTTARFTRFASLLVVFAPLLSEVAPAQAAAQAWVQRYNGPGNAADYASQVALDANGNVYVAGISWGGDPMFGGSSGDWATIKYSSAGVPLWTNYYNGPANNFDGAYAIVVDASGNVFVTGDSSSGSDSVAVTIKYSSGGVPLWTNRDSTLGFGQIIALDASGNVIVMGTAWTGGCLTIKYSSAGALLWARTYTDYARGDGRPVTLAVDAGGNALVVGGSSSSAEFLTLKYSSAGVLLWTKRYKGPGINAPSRANGVAVDASSNVYVTGQSAGTGNEPHGDYATIKYSSAGVPLWTNRYSKPTPHGEIAQAIALDVSGNVYVSGTTYGGTLGDDFTTIKYSSAGVPLWTNLYHTVGEAVALAVDVGGNVYVTGGSSGDYGTAAYSSSGVPLWTNRYNGPGNGMDQPWSLAADASGIVYVTGSSVGAGTGDELPRLDWATVKYVTPPVITSQPMSRTNPIGTTASFSVEVAGVLPFSYQWRRQGTNLLESGNLSGVTTTNLLIANVQLADAGGYTVVVTNAYGSVTGNVAQLTVVVPPNPGRFTNFGYSPTTGFSFIFRDATIGKPYRIQTSLSLTPGSWEDWMSFNYTGPLALTDMSALDATNKFYRAITP